MQDLLRKATELLKIKNIITLMATIVFVIMSLTGKIASDDTMMIVMLVYTYFFNKNTTDKR